MTSTPTIRRLPQHTINRIAAGEVVERPASAIKELVENALDAGATQIDIRYEAGGRRSLSVQDDGKGMTRDELLLCIERHATSKLTPDDEGSWDLLNISSMGFRGEALPSIGSVSRLSITTQTLNAESAWAINVDGGELRGPKPAPRFGLSGTRVDVRDLFYATPARLKFLKTERSESMAISDMVKRLAMARADVGFSLHNGTRSTLNLPAEADNADGRLKRLADILGHDFRDNALEIDAEREGITLTGFAGLPTYSRGASTHQYLFINGRPVRDKLLYGAVRGAYQDFLARGRHPIVALYVELDPQSVDVNVHPAKTEVRFRDPGLVRGLIVSALRKALSDAGHRASTTVSDYALGRIQTGQPSYQYQGRYGGPPQGYAPYRNDPSMQPLIDGMSEMSGRVEEASDPWTSPTDMTPTAPAPDYPLGTARAQLHETYVVAQTADGIVIVDQHAAHERLVYERLKKQMAQHGVAAQALLIPEIITLSDGDAQLLLSHADALSQYGLTLEPFGPATIAVRETPAILGTINAEAMLRDILDELHDLGASANLQSRVEAILSRMACHGSIRSGRRMQADEMNALLREMEATPHSGQCNHGRPTYVSLNLTDIERLFGRT